MDRYNLKAISLQRNIIRVPVLLIYHLFFRFLYFSSYQGPYDHRCLMLERFAGENPDPENARSLLHKTLFFVSIL